MKSRKRFASHSWIALLSCLFFSSASHAQKSSPDELLVLSNVTVVNVRTGTLLPEQTVILERNRIASVGPSKSAKYPRNAPSVNCRGLFLIPGLWDMHVHLVFGDWFPDAKDFVAAFRRERRHRRARHGQRAGRRAGMARRN